MELPAGPYRQQVIDVLRDLVRIDTTNPPGNETACARYLADLLRPAGIETRILEAAPGRGNLVARLRGSGEARPIMLMGHTDVVAANPEEWQYPPFGAEMHAGYIWGRGATDMKQMVAANAVTLLALAASGLPLKRDVILAATADEEHGGRLGMGWLVRNLPEILEAECAINEGGGGATSVGGRLFYTCQTAEKGVCRLVVTARAEGRHASQPRRDIATLKLARAISRLGDGYLQAHAIPTMRAALHTVAAAQSSYAAQRVDAMLDEGRIDEALAAAGLDAEGVRRMRPLFYDTAAVTGLAAGDPESINVIPASAVAYIDGRILPGQTREGFVNLVQSHLGNDVQVEVFRNQYSTGLESPFDAPIYSLIEEVVAERCDGAALIPWQCAGSTDAKHLIPRGLPVFGFIPSKPLPPRMSEAGAHANNERIWIENVPFALEMLYDIVARFCLRG
jgi:acetylornithine deacetylase/succinyl-diaminopimelate desuccinylase-like protein